MKRSDKAGAGGRGSGTGAQAAVAGAARKTQTPESLAPGPRPLAPIVPILALALVLVALAAYANHFENHFHFTDDRFILQNPNIRSLLNIPRIFFTEDHPIVIASLAFDFRLSGGFQPLWFHISTFIWFSALLVLMFLLFRRILDGNLWAALFGAALFGLHPANAETVNNIIQRGEVYGALGVVASLWLFIAYPEQRKRFWYLLPVVVASLANPAALIFPFILVAYIWLFERERTPLGTTLPAFGATLVLGLLIWKLTPAASTPFHTLAQPWAALYYFRSFFLPISLSADHGWDYSGGLTVAAGVLFVLALIAGAVYTAQRREMRPVAFGIVWFLLALIPAAFTPSAEAVNDYRMFIPFVGLALAVGWASSTDHRFSWSVKLWPAALVILLAAAIGTYVRNNVWHTEESVWRDAANKNPQNSRALALYGHSLVQGGDNTASLPYLQRAQELRPNDTDVEIDLAIANGGAGNDNAAARLFERAEAMAPNDPRPYYYYARWLKEKSRLGESRAHLETALRLNPAYLEAHELLARINGAQDQSAGVKPGENVSPEALLNQSAEDCKTGRYTECLAEAAQALKLRPGWAEAYGNISAAFLGMNRWDEGIQAARQALELNPYHQASKNNLRWALEHKPK